MATMNNNSFDKNRFSLPSDVLNIVLEHIPQGMIVVGPDFRTLAFNPHFEEMFQLPLDTVKVGQDFRDILRVWAKETGQDQKMLDYAISQQQDLKKIQVEQRVPTLRLIRPGKPLPGSVLTSDS